ncbi:MAG: hypothetical protein Q7S74_00655 [Nanoarchaeota archaeon]|nr:hypothetical protein [Nanoarchaeota archaeon]
MKAIKRTRSSNNTKRVKKKNTKKVEINKIDSKKHILKDGTIRKIPSVNYPSRVIVNRIAEVFKNG